MARATTHASTKTMPRLLFLKTQAMYILGEIVPNLDNSDRNIIAKGIDEKLLQHFIVYGKNKKNEVEVELLLTIDWERHTLEVKKNAEIKLDKSCDDNGVITALKNIAFLFNGEVEKYNLSVELRYSIRSDVDRKQAQQRLGLQSGDRPNYAAGISEMSLPLDILPELGVTIKSKG